MSLCLMFLLSALLGLGIERSGGELRDVYFFGFDSSWSICISTRAISVLDWIACISFVLLGYTINCELVGAGRKSSESDSSKPWS